MRKIAIIGCGINGIGCAIALAESGYDVHIFDKKKPFSETSSKSSKLLHGGIRYLENGHLNLVRESLQERAAWVKQMPDHTKINRFFIPVYQNLSRNIFILFAGVKLYEFLAGKFSLGKSKFHGRKNTLQLNKSLRSEGLIGSVSYVDVQMDDEAISAKLLAKAERMGVKIIDNTEVTNFDLAGKVETDSHSIKYDFIVNACGPWVKASLDKNKINTKYEIEHVRGSHIIVNKKISNPLVLQNPSDKRIIFMLPIKEGTLIGTTEIKHDLAKPIECSKAEQKYLIDNANNFIQEPLDAGNVISNYSGVRALVSQGEKNLSSINRDSAIELNGKLINVFGGKWTSGLSLGKKVANLIQN
tara:strand:+ start:10031 stop:11104 length:1074 start_codon:yes stop_codon:yes gene_type:complete